MHKDYFPPRVGATLVHKHFSDSLMKITKVSISPFGKFKIDFYMTSNGVKEGSWVDYNWDHFPFHLYTLLHHDQGEDDELYI